MGLGAAALDAGIGAPQFVRCCSQRAGPCGTSPALQVAALHAAFRGDHGEAWKRVAKS